MEELLSYSGNFSYFEDYNRYLDRELSKAMITNNINMIKLIKNRVKSEYGSWYFPLSFITAVKLNDKELLKFTLKYSAWGNPNNFVWRLREDNLLSYDVVKAIIEYSGIDNARKLPDLQEFVYTLPLEQRHELLGLELYEVVDLRSTDRNLINSVLINTEIFKRYDNINSSKLFSLYLNTIDSLSEECYNPNDCTLNILESLDLEFYRYLDTKPIDHILSVKSESKNIDQVICKYYKHLFNHRNLTYDQLDNIIANENLPDTCDNIAGEFLISQLKRDISLDEFVYFIDKYNLKDDIYGPFGLKYTILGLANVDIIKFLLEESVKNKSFGLPWILYIPKDKREYIMKDICPDIKDVIIDKMVNIQSNFDGPAFKIAMNIVEIKYLLSEYNKGKGSNIFRKLFEEMILGQV